MNFKDSLITIRQNARLLGMRATGQANNQILVESGLIGIRRALNELQKIEVFKEDIDVIYKDTALFKSGTDNGYFDQNSYNILAGQLAKINLKVSTLLKFWGDIVPLREDAIDIKLPDVKTFSALESIVKDLKLSIEVTLESVSIDHNLEIITAEPGSIWLQVALGTELAVRFIGNICKKAAEIRIHFAKAKEAEQFARMLQLNGDAMQNLIEQTKKSNDLLLESLGKQLLDGKYDTVTQETKRHVELSIKTFAELMEKGAKFLPESNIKEINESFPEEPDNVGFISEMVKKIENNGN